MYTFTKHSSYTFQKLKTLIEIFNIYLNRPSANYNEAAFMVLKQYTESNYIC